MNLREIYYNKKNVISLEVFPPKNDEDGVKVQHLYEELKELKEFSPSLVSVTYGAGGSNKTLSHDILKYVKTDLNLNVMPHFTCVCSKKSEIEKYLEEIKDLDIKNILALRGDEPKDITVCYNDFRYANELVEFIKERTNLSIAVAGYPEGHILAPDLETDIQNLKRKVECGADVIYTQMFFENNKFFDFVHLVREAGIDIPIIPGILPIISYSQFDKMKDLAKVTVPKTLEDRLYKFKDNSDDIKKLGIEFASYQCQQLIDAGVNGLHFYTLNKSHSVSEILTNLFV